MYSPRKQHLDQGRFYSAVNEDWNHHEECVIQEDDDVKNS